VARVFRQVQAAALVTLLLASPVSAQVAAPLTPPLANPPGAWAPDHRKVADVFGTIGVYGQIGADTLASWRAPSRRTAFWKQGCRMGLAIGLSEASKRALDSPRPDGSDHRGMPSEHTATAIAAIAPAPGWSFAVSLPVAAFVGTSRIAAARHSPRQVVAGAAIGVLAQWVCR
jgi:membrane-associated phospholipid phosphatase